MLGAVAPLAKILFSTIEKSVPDKDLQAKLKAMMNQTNQENKLEQTEELAKLRAGVSLAKQGVQQMKIRGM